MTECNTKCCEECGCRAVCAVDPALSPRIERFLQQPELILGLMQTYGSPLNLVFPQAVRENQRRFNAVLEDQALPGEILFTSKPNRSGAILAAVGLAGISVDVSSSGSLTQTLNAGVPGTRIQASGPKSIDYLYLALRHRAAISIDSEEELRRVAQLVQSNSSLAPARIEIRLCKFTSTRMQFSPSDTPFGIRTDRVPSVLEVLKQCEDRMSFEGFHYHVPTQSADERVVIFEQTLHATLEALRLGLTPRGINIGGGWKIRYARDHQQWQRFQSYLKRSVIGEVKPITWDGSGLGYRMEGGRLAGAPSFPDHSPPLVSHEEFGSFLGLQCPEFGHASVATLLRDHLLELRTEPGRALLDQAGCTLATVNSTKESRNGELIIQLDMNHTHLLSREQKLLTQPIFIPRSARKPSEKGAFLFGNLCIESDLIQYMKTYPGFIPQRGDIVVFPNTAAYHMDFTQSAILHQRMPARLAALETDGSIQLLADDPAVFLQHSLGNLS